VEEVVLINQTLRVQQGVQVEVVQIEFLLLVVQETVQVHHQVKEIMVELDLMEMTIVMELVVVEVLVQSVQMELLVLEVLEVQVLLHL
jgi:hypothetical protein